MKATQHIGLVFLLLLAACQPAEESPQPNIVLIMADDMGYCDLGIHGNRLIETPNLDAMARESVQFSQFYVTPVCASTRASLLTGRNFLRTGVSHVHGGKDFLHLDEVTIADKLREAGYATGMWGKWHSGKTPGYFPWDRGFDEAYMAALYRHKDNHGVQNGVPRETDGWYSEVMVDDAMDFIRRKQEGPFFAYLPFMACHSPLLAPENYVQKYRDKGLSENLSTLYAMVDHMDAQIGRLLQFLEDEDLAENTVVLFLSDNGPAVINNLLDDDDRRTRYVNGMRGHKGNIWENGIRSPLFVQWKGKYEAAVVEHLADVCDLFPTLLDLAGVAEQDIPGNLDGRSIVSYFSAGAELMEGKEIFLYANPGWPPTDRPWTPEGVKDEYRPWKYAEGDNLSFEKQIIGIRNEDYKLLMNPGLTDGSVRRDEEGYVLVDIRKDPQERSSVFVSKEKEFRQLKKSLREKYEDIYGSVHAFEMPVYVIASGAEKSTVLTYGPRRTSETVKGASGYVCGFSTSGDWAEYDVEVEEAGVYALELQYSLESDEPVSFTLEMGEEEKLMQLLPGQSTLVLEGLHLPAGPGRWIMRSEDAVPEGSLKMYQMNIQKQ